MSEDNPTLQAPPPRSSFIVIQVALVLSVLALGLSAWQWLENLKSSTALQQQLTQKISEMSDNNRESLLNARQALDSARRAEVLAGTLQARLDESRAQQEALQTLYLELANNRDSWAIAEVEQLLVIASQQLQLAGNVRSALLALQNASSRLQQIDKPHVIQLRKAIESDIQALQSLPTVDIVSMNLKLDSLIAGVDQLTLLSERLPRTAPEVLPAWSSQPWQRLLEEVWHDLKRMVRIEHMQRPEPEMLAPEQAYFLRENMKLQLLAARIALLQRDNASYYAALNRVESLLTRYFDTRDNAARSALATLDQLTASGITFDMPDISASLNAVSKYKLSMEGMPQ